MENRGVLYLIPTSIGETSLKDVLLDRDILIVESLNYFIVETPKIARAHLKGLNVVLQDLDMRVLNRHTRRKDIPFLLEPLIEGSNVGLMSDAGTPAIADPGSIVVRECHRLGVKVIPLIGPSSIILALMASGLNGQSFTFNGYLPRDSESRQRRIRELESISMKTGTSQVFMETPYRNKLLLKDIIQVCQKNTDLSIAVNVSGKDEYIKTMRIEEWRHKKSVNIINIPTIFILQGRK